MAGSTSSTWGPRRWMRALTGATSTRGMRPGSRRRQSQAPLFTPTVVPRHGGLDAVGEDELDGVGRFLDHDLQLGAFALAGPAQHVVGAPLLAARRLADADANAGEVAGVQVVADR